MQKDLKKIFERSGDVYKEVVPTVRNIIENVKKDGDRALYEYSKKFDKVDIEAFEITEDEIQSAYENTSSEFIRALKISIENQYKFQKSLLNKNSGIIETRFGINLWREWRPIEKVGLYVPGGRARYPSSVIMVGIPAIIAGCGELVICSPPDSEGNLPKSTLAALAEISRLGDTKIRVFKIGGAQAIVSMAYGTESVPKVYKIFGAGNSYVTAAKMEVFGKVDIDMPAGPSEVMIIADENANPKWVAADLISQCEHGEESAGVLITDSIELAEKVKEEAYKQVENLETKETIINSLGNYGAAIIVNDLEEGVNIVNEYAPEHLEIVVNEYKKIKEKVLNAGSVFLGPFASEPAGDYATGGNHVLPTNGFAKMFEALSVDAFGKQIEFQELTKQGLKSIKDTVDVFGKEEGLPAHSNSVDVRFE